MRYKPETVADVIEEMVVLNQMHYDEIATHRHIKRLDPDYSRYYSLEEAGCLRIFTARDSGCLVGYFITFITPHMHYQECIYALNDILYVHPDYRKSTVSYRLIVNAIEDIKENTGANVLCLHMKVKYPFRHLLTKLGFQLTEENWEIEL